MASHSPTHTTHSRVAAPKVSGKGITTKGATYEQEFDIEMARLKVGPRGRSKACFVVCAAGRGQRGGRLCAAPGGLFRHRGQLQMRRHTPLSLSPPLRPARATPLLAPPSRPPAQQGKVRSTAWGCTYRAPPEILHGYDRKVTGKTASERLDLRWVGGHATRRLVALERLLRCICRPRTAPPPHLRPQPGRDLGPLSCPALAPRSPPPPPPPQSCAHPKPPTPNRLRAKPRRAAAKSDKFAK